MYGKRILLGITGGIAAYKIAYLIRILKKKEAEVKCIMTPASCDFISPLVVSTLSENEVSIEFWDKSSGKWNNHVDYAKWGLVICLRDLKLYRAIMFFIQWVGTHLACQQKMLHDKII